MDHRQPTPVIASGPDGPALSEEPLRRSTVPAISAAIGFLGLFETTKAPVGSTEIPFAFPDAVKPTPLGGIHCATGRIDDHGRVSERSAVRALKWAPGQHLTFASDGLSIRVRPADDGRWTVGRAGYLTLPAEYRHSCNLVPGDQVFITATPEHQLLVAMPMPVLAAALWNYRPQMWETAS